ncbi:MAG: O-antigen ligase family protein [Candidatus Yanofskybacteria bacterium]|nr:O-antigen ligase family protein [Candidatus Yanofskybacteria bacterium]
MHKKLPVNLIFVLHLALFILVVSGVLPRAIIPFWTAGLLLYALFSPLEESAVFFVRSIPLFIAIPLTAGYDALNMWRLMSLVIFGKWLVLKYPFDFQFGPWKRRRLLISILVLFAMSLLSLSAAPEFGTALKRIIYFLNLSLIGIVIYDVARQEGTARRLAANIAVPIVIVTLAGFIQLGMAYSMDIFQFVDIWVHTVERNLFGSAWAEIALKANTWFAYYGDQLSLRMFSLFPDSHSFPIFILLGLPAVLAISLKGLVAKADSLRGLFFSRARLLVVFVPFVLLAALLSGTRGIWAAVIGVILFALALIYIFKRQGVEQARRRLFIYLSTFLVLFFLLFPVAYGVFVSDQFQARKSDAALFRKRVRSIIDIAETSNKERIRIWTLSLKSIASHPFLGRGIGNFPVVLNQDIGLGKAGSSAHNLYLHIAAEMGLLALVAALYALWLVIKKIYDNFRATKDPVLLIYNGSLLLFLPWVLIYSLTDVALFDERAFLLFVATIAITQAHH